MPFFIVFFVIVSNKLSDGKRSSSPMDINVTGTTEALLTLENPKYPLEEIPQEATHSTFWEETSEMPAYYWCAMYLSFAP